MAERVWTFTCRECGKTQQQAVSGRTVRCEACNKSRVAPRPEPRTED